VIVGTRHFGRVKYDLMRLPEKPVAQPLTHMWERHREMARRLVAGDRPSDIADSMGITKSRFSIICNSPIFFQYVGELSQKTDVSIVDMRNRIVNNAPKALEILEDVLKNETGKFDAKLKVKVAQDMLDRGDLGAVHKSMAITTTLTESDFVELKRRKFEMKVINP
jgi:hypothetical protein